MDAARTPSASLAFGRFEVLPHRRELLAGGQQLKLGGRAFDLLMARVWPSRVVEESALQVQISALRAAFGAERELIRTVSGRGYQFTGEIRPPPEDIVERTDATPTDRGSALLPS